MPLTRYLSVEVNEMWSRIVPAAMLMMALAQGCAVDAEESPASAADDAGGAGGTGTALCEGCGGLGGEATAAPTFEEVVQTAFVATGCVTGCHDSKGYGGLSLSHTRGQVPDADLAYAALVGAISGSKECKGQPLVVPGAPEQSLLWLKMAAELDVPGIEVCGASMPKGTKHITEADLDLVEDWILAGAQR